MARGSYAPDGSYISSSQDDLYYSNPSQNPSNYQVGSGSVPTPQSGSGSSFWSSLGNVLLGGLPGMLGSLGSGILGYFGQKESNEAMLENTRLTNEHNYKMWLEQKQHNVDMFNMENQANIDMWNMQNAYNDPSAQVERLRKAGLNPSMAMSGNTAGTATSAPKGASANPAQAPTMQGAPPQAFTSPGLMAGQLALQSLMGISSALGQSQQTSANEQMLPYLLGNQKQTNILLAEQTKTQGLENQLRQSVLHDQILSYQANRMLSQLHVDQQEVLNRYLDGHQQYQLAIECAQASLYALQYNLTEKQIDEIAQRIAESFQNIAESKSRTAVNYAQANAINVSTEQSEEMFPLVKAGKTQENLQLWQNTRILQHTVGSIIKRTIAENGYYSIFFDNETDYQKYIHKEVRNSPEWLPGLAPFYIYGSRWTNENSPIFNLIK